MVNRLDKVDKRELKRSFKDRSDRDLNNDGISSGKDDKYLHSRRKKVSKIISKNRETLEKETRKGDVETQVENKDPKMKHKQTKGAAKAQKYDDQDSPGAEKMRKDHKIKVDDTEEKGHVDAVKAGRNGPKTKARPGDQSDGDRNIINKVTQKESIDFFKLRSNLNESNDDEEENSEESNDSEEEVENLDELSKKTLKKYIGKASDDRKDLNRQIGATSAAIDHNYNNAKRPGEHDRDREDHLYNRMDKLKAKEKKREKGMKKAFKRFR